MNNGNVIISSLKEIDQYGKVPFGFDSTEEEFGLFFFENKSFIKTDNEMQASITVNNEILKLNVVKDNSLNEIFIIDKNNNNSIIFNQDCKMKDLIVNSITCESDINLKENITNIDNALDKINKITPVNYSFIKDKNKKMKMGVIAQEIKEILPNLVSEFKGELSVDYVSLIGLLLKAIKEQQSQISELKEELNIIKNNLK